MKMSKIETAMRSALAFYKAFNRHDITGVMTIMSPDCVVESSLPGPDGFIFSGQEAVGQYWQDFFRQLPDAHIDIEEIFGLGWRCIARWKLTWMDKDGNSQHVRGVDIFRIGGDSIQELFRYTKG